MSTKKKLIFSAVFIAITVLTASLVVINPTWLPIDTHSFVSADKRAQQQQEEEAAEIAATEKKRAEIRASGVMKLIPGDAITVSHANGSKAHGGADLWWKNYTRLLMRDVKLPASLPASLGVTSITSASFANPDDTVLTRPLGWVIALTVPVDKLDALVEHLASGKSDGVFLHRVQDGENGYVLASGTDSFTKVEPFVLAVNEGTEQTSSFAAVHPDFKADVEAEFPKMIIRVSDYLEFFTHMRADGVEFSEVLMSKGFGVSPNTVWEGVTKDDGITWDGNFTSGGVDVNALDPQAISDALTGEISFDWINEDDPSQPFMYGYMNYGMSVISEAFSVSKAGKTAGAVVNPHSAKAQPQEAPVPPEGGASIMFSPQMFQATYNGAVAPFNVHTVTMVLGLDGRSSFTFDYFADEDFDKKGDPDIERTQPKDEKESKKK